MFVHSFHKVIASKLGLPLVSLLVYELIWQMEISVLEPANKSVKIFDLMLPALLSLFEIHANTAHT